ncbi:hypothetical protein RYX36_010075 [Vicia faba]
MAYTFAFQFCVSVSSSEVSTVPAENRCDCMGFSFGFSGECCIELVVGLCLGFWAYWCCNSFGCFMVGIGNWDVWVHSLCGLSFDLEWFFNGSIFWPLGILQTVISFRGDALFRELVLQDTAAYDGQLENATVVVDALSVCMTINGWEMMIPFSFFAGTGVRVANELGAGKWKSAKFAMQVSLVQSTVIGLIFCILIVIFKREFAYIFTSSTHVLQTVNDMSILLGVSIVLNSVQPVLSAFCNAYGNGLTDWSLASTYGKLAIFTIGAWAGASQGGVLASLAACGVMMNIVSTASDLMQDFKTGYLTLASPRSMFVRQIIGTAMGCVISPCVFWIFYKAFPDLGTPKSRYPAPNAIVFRNMAILRVQGFGSLPNNCLLLCYIFFGAAIVINLIKDLVGKVGRFIPLPMAMAIPFYLGPYFAIDMCVGSLILFVWEKVNKAKVDAFAPAVASGLICGDGIYH